MENTLRINVYVILHRFINFLDRFHELRIVGRHRLLSFHNGLSSVSSAKAGNKGISAFGKFEQFLILWPSRYFQVSSLS